MTTFDPAIHALAVCSVPLSRDGSQAVDVRPHSTLDRGRDGAVSREKFIADACEEWKQYRVSHKRDIVPLTCRSWVNGNLREAGLDLLAAAEAKEMESVV